MSYTVLLAGASDDIPPHWHLWDAQCVPVPQEHTHDYSAAKVWAAESAWDNAPQGWEVTAIDYYVVEGDMNAHLGLRPLSVSGEETPWARAELNITHRALSRAKVRGGELRALRKPFLMIDNHSVLAWVLLLTCGDNDPESSGDTYIRAIVREVGILRREPPDGLSDPTYRFESF